MTHRIEVSISGSANDSTAVDLNDAEALPVYVQLKQLLTGAKAPRKASAKTPSRRKGPGLSPADEATAVEAKKETTERNDG